MLTERQAALLRFVDARIRETGYAPSYDEMARAVGIVAKSGVHRLIGSLEERGFVRRIPNRARALEVIRMPGDAPSRAAPPRARPAPGAVDGAARFREIPVMGRVASGTPVPAIRHRTGTMVLSEDMLGPGDHYALVAGGDAMVGAGILDGDVVILRRQGSAVAGEVVLAVVDGEEAVLRRLRRRGAAVILEPANPAYETRTFAERRVAVEGVLAGLQRLYG